MEKVGIHKVNIEFQEMIKKLSGGMAAISSTILILAASGKLPHFSGVTFSIITTAFSVPLLVISMILSYQIIDKQEVAEKSFDCLGKLFAFGIASAIPGYILLLVKASLWAPLAFVAGIALGGGLYTKAIKSIKSHKN